MAYYDDSEDSIGRRILLGDRDEQASPAQPQEGFVNRRYFDGQYGATQPPVTPGATEQGTRTSIGRTLLARNNDAGIQPGATEQTFPRFARFRTSPENTVPPAAPEVNRVPPAGPVATGLRRSDTATRMNAATPAMTRPSMVAALPPPPEAPQADPRRAEAMNTIANTSSPINPRDAQGKTLPQYRPGVGARILRGVGDFFSGGIPGVIRGAVDPNAPGFYGRGALNNQYFRDEAMRKAQNEGATAEQAALDKEAGLQERDFQNRNTQYRDEARTAAQQDVLAERQARDEQMAKTREEMNQIRDAYEKLREEAEKYKEENANVTYDKASGQFVSNGHVFTPKNVEQGAVLEAREGIDGPYTALWKQERRNQPITVHTGETGKFTARDAAKIRAYARANNIAGNTPEEIAGKMTPEQLDRALSNTLQGGEVFINAAERNEYNRRTATLDRQIAGYEEDLRKNSEAAAMPGLDANSKATMDAMAKAAQDKITALETQKKGIEDEIVKRRPQGASSTPQPAPMTPQANNRPANRQQTPQLTPIPDRQVTSPGGKVYKVGDMVKDPADGKQKAIKSFSKDQQGKVHANF